MGSIPNRDEARALVHEYTTNENLRRHMLAVEAAMRAYALKYGEDPDCWGVTGLLHDFDYERWPNEERLPDREHPSTGVAILRERGVSEEICEAILAHAHEYTGVEPRTRMAKALCAVDDLTGFIVACSLVRPGGIVDLKPKSVNKKMKDRSFAAAVDRDAMRAACERLGEDMSDHITFVIDAMRGIAGELGLEGTDRS
ncbi:MAG: HDIG domain-containing metalloprotein [Gemmatimonadota bacterium]